MALIAERVDPLNKLIIEPHKLSSTKHSLATARDCESMTDAVRLCALQVQLANSMIFIHLVKKTGGLVTYAVI
jgi:hypothetical protein